MQFLISSCKDVVVIVLFSLQGQPLKTPESTPEKNAPLLSSEENSQFTPDDDKPLIDNATDPVSQNGEAGAKVDIESDDEAEKNCDEKPPDVHNAPPEAETLSNDSESSSKTFKPLLPSSPEDTAETDSLKNFKKKRRKRKVKGYPWGQVKKKKKKVADVS